MVSGRVAVIGAAGQLGSDLIAALGERAIAVTHEQVDVVDLEALTATLPDGLSCVVNTAAYHDVDGCEADPARAMRVNAGGAWAAATAAAARGAGVVFISSDFVFDGETGAPYDENGAVRPVNVYGASKAAGEMLVRIANARHLIVRTAYLFGRRRSGKGWNVVSAIVEQARRRQTLRCATDLVFSPTFTEDLARTLVELLDRGATGTVHLTNAGWCTREELTRFVLETAGLDTPVVPICAAELPWRARRPRFSALVSSTLDRLGCAALPPWRDAVRRYLANGGLA